MPHAGDEPLAALEERFDEAVAQFEKALSYSAASPVIRSLIQSMYGSLLGERSVAAQTAGEAAYRWFVDTGSFGYIAVSPEIAPPDEGLAHTS